MLVTNKTFERTLRMLADTKGGRMLHDVETTTDKGQWQGDRVAGIALADPKRLDNAAYFPLRHAEGPNLNDRCVRDLLRFLRRPYIWTGWNNKFDTEMLTWDGVPLPDEMEDAMLGLHLVDENQINYKLKESAQRLIDPNAGKQQQRLADLLTSQGYPAYDYWRLPAHEVAPYGVEDVVLTEHMRQFIVEELVAWGLETVWDEVNQLALATARLELRGMQLDVDLIEKLQKKIRPKMRRLERKLADLAEYEINPRSAPQMQAFFGMSSTDKEHLEPLIDKVDGVRELLEYRGWKRVDGSYYTPFLHFCDENGVLHPNFNLHGTVAGRPSVYKPALQAIPRYTDVYQVKDVFVARPGHVIVSADYSQMELRLGAHYAHDKALQRAYQRGEDVHQQTGDELGVPRHDGKTTNFSLLYGVGAKTFARRMGWPVAKAKRFLERVHKQHPNYRPLYEYMQRMATRQEYIRLWTGRARRYNTPTLERETHKALSNLIQGGVAEIMRLAIMRLDRSMVQTGIAHILLQVHDQLLIEAPEENADAAIERTHEAMLNFPGWRVPFQIDVSVGKRWGKLTPWKRD